MVAKQPQVQEKMMEVMRPKMAEIGPKLQQAMNKFAAEQQAKRAAAPPTPTPEEDQFHPAAGSGREFRSCAGG